MFRTGCTASLTAALFILPFFSASGQILKQVEQELSQMAEAAKRCCVKLDVLVQRDTAIGVLKDENQDGKGETHLEFTSSQGLNLLSGVLLDQEGHVATVGQALVGAVRVSVSLYSGERFKARLIGYNLDTNVGLVKIQGEIPIELLPLGDSDSVRPGSIVMGLGYTYNLQPSPACSVGIVSATDREFRFRSQKKILKNLFQISLVVYPGEMGGPLVNTSSEVVGLMLTSYAPQRYMNPFTGDPGQRGCTIVMPSNRLREEIARILAQEKGEARPADTGQGGVWLGISADNIEDQALRKQLGIPAGGVLVSHIYPNDPAARAGIQENDVLKMWNQDLIEGIAHFRKLVESAKVGDHVKFVVIRQGKPIQINVQLGRY